MSKIDTLEAVAGINAKENSMARRSRKKSKKQRIEESEARLKKRAKKLFENESGVIMRNNASQEKMSEVILKFIEPYRRYAGSTNAVNSLVALALVAWNTTLLPPEKRQESLEESILIMPEEMRDMCRDLLSEMMKRKQRYFSQYDRMVLDFEVADMGDGFHLSVVSTLDGE